MRNIENSPSGRQPAKEQEGAPPTASPERPIDEIVKPITARGRLILRAIESDARHELDENPELRNAAGFNFSSITEPRAGDSFDARINMPELLGAFPDQDPDALLMYGAMVGGVKLGDP